MNQKDMDEWVLVIKNSIAQRLKRNHSQLTASSVTGGVGKFWKHTYARARTGTHTYMKNSIAQRLKRNHSQLTASSVTGGVGKFWKHVRTRSQAHIRSMRINAHIHEEFHCAAPQAQLPEA